MCALPCFQVAAKKCRIAPKSSTIFCLVQKAVKIQGIQGLNGSVNSFLGFAPASLLHRVSFADVLDEQTGEGYQRRFNARHSMDFRYYIESEGSATIPLTFNLRKEFSSKWRVLGSGEGVTLEIDAGTQPMARVDCQHRLGFLTDLDIPLPFMAYIGLSVTQEMAAFNVINAKARGLPGSLIDYHDSKLIEDIESIRPELVLAVRLNDDPRSPWYKRLDLGGNRTSGLTRRASLRTMQKAIKRFLRSSREASDMPTDLQYEVVVSFWRAVAAVMRTEWEDPRKHMLCKGVGVYALMQLASDLVIEARLSGTVHWESFFSAKLVEFAPSMDWSNAGPLRGLGGGSGVTEAVRVLRNLRSSKRMELVN